MQSRISNIEKMVGFFIFLCLLVVGAFLVLNIKEGKLFARHIHLFTVLEKGYGFEKGSPVKVNGIDAGIIDDIILEEGNKVRISISLPAHFLEHIHQDAVAQINEPLAIGKTEINILPGSNDQPLVADGAYLNPLASDSMNQRLNKIDTVLEDMHQTLAPVPKTMEHIEAATEHLESIMRKIDKGEGSLGQMVNDQGLYKSAKDAVDSTRTIVEGIKSTKIFVGVDADYYNGQDLTAGRLHLKVVPRDSRYFLLGMTYLKPSTNSPITVDSSQNYKLAPEIEVAQKVFDNRLTIRGGMLEGKFGGGADYELLPQTKDRLLFTIEGRDTYREDKFNEHIDATLLRTKIKLTVHQYFHLEVGGDNLLDKPAFFVGIGFEYLDEDISKIIGLIGASK